MAMANTQHCFVTTITDEKLPGYRHHHDNIWPEVAAGLRAAGIASLKIYSMPSGKPGINTLVMNIETDGNINLSAATGPGSKYRSDPKCKEWEELMDSDFHGGWTEAKLIHNSAVEWNKALGLK